MYRVKACTWRFGGLWTLFTGSTEYSSMFVLNCLVSYVFSISGEMKAWTHFFYRFGEICMMLCLYYYFGDIPIENILFTSCKKFTNIRPQSFYFWGMKRENPPIENRIIINVFQVMIYTYSESYFCFGF